MLGIKRENDQSLLVEWPGTLGRDTAVLRPRCESKVLARVMERTSRCVSGTAVVAALSSPCQETNQKIELTPEPTAAELRGWVVSSPVKDKASP